MKTYTESQWQLMGNKIHALFLHGICTDPSCNQYMIQHNDYVYEFCEDRIINPDTKETEMFMSIIDIRETDEKHIQSILSTYGYTLHPDYKLEGYSDEESRQLIAECIFEQSN